MHSNKDIHLNFNKMKKNIFYSEFYWNSLIKDIKIFIENCHVCNAKNQGKKL